MKLPRERILRLQGTAKKMVNLKNLVNFLLIKVLKAVKLLRRGMKKLSKRLNLVNLIPLILTFLLNITAPLSRLKQIMLVKLNLLITYLVFGYMALRELVSRGMRGRPTRVHMSRTAINGGTTIKMKKTLSLMILMILISYWVIFSSGGGIIMHLSQKLKVDPFSLGLNG